jgi:hypothetical protein
VELPKYNMQIEEGGQAPGARDQTRHSAQICDGLEKICVPVKNLREAQIFY